nr:ribonuclease H-like domain-containing protein [Tanacetum cinerariifolium]
MLKTRDYDLWSMKMKQYLTHTNHVIWEVIVNGDAPTAIASVIGGAEADIPPKTTKQKISSRNELKAKSTLLLAIFDEHLLMFHGIKDAKILLEEIKTRFEGNKESKKMQKTILKQQYENFATSRSEAWNTHTLIMQNKSDLDTLSKDDLYNNLKVYKTEIKIQSRSSSNSHNVIFISLDNTSGTNEAVNTAHDVSAASSQGQAFALTYADDVMFSFFTNQSNSPQLDNEDLEQIDIDDLEKMDLKCLSSSDTEVHTCSKECLQSYQTLQKQYDQQREVLNKANLEIIAYQLGLESLEARIVVHQKNEVVFEEDIAILKYYDKNLTKLIDSQISATDKTILGYAGHVNESEVLNNVVDSCESDGDDNQVNDRFKKSEGYHTVSPPCNGNYMPPEVDLSFVGLDDSLFKSKVSETIISMPKIETNAFKTSKDSLEKPKSVRSSAPNIEDWESASEDKNVFKPKEVKKTIKPSLEKNEFVNARNTIVKNKNKAKKPRKFSQSPRGKKRN